MASSFSIIDKLLNPHPLKDEVYTYVVTTAVGIVANKEDVTNEFLEKMYKSYKGLELLKPCPLFYVHSGSITIWPNIMVTLKTVTKTSIQKSKNSITSYINERIKKGLPKNQVDTTNGIYSFVYGGYTSVTFEVFINKYTNAKEIGLTDAKIRDLAHVIRSMHGEYKLVLCERPEDYATMYDCRTGSCMDHGGSTNATIIPRHEEFRKATGMHPGSFYHYMGRVQGCYLVEAGKKDPVARSLLIKNEKGKIIEFYNTRGTSGTENHAILTQMLKDKGYKPLSLQQLPHEGEFRVPVFTHPHDKKLVIPFPYNSGMHGQMHMEYDVHNKEVVVRACKSGEYSNFSRTEYSNGFIQVSPLPRYTVKAKKAV